jgi:hypothetical protein
MTNTSTRKPKQENYAYSWFLPAPGNNSHTEPHNHAPEVEMQHEQAHPTPVRPSARARQMDPTRVKMAGLIGWSAVVAVGATILLMRAGPFPAFQVSALGGVWLAVSAGIWFLPKYLMR